jgi:hypothetical protein
MGLIQSKADTAPPPMPNFAVSPVVKAAIDDLKARPPAGNPAVCVPPLTQSDPAGIQGGLLVAPSSCAL